MEAMLPGPRSYQAHKRPQGQDRGGMLGFSGLPQHGHGSDTPPKVTGRIKQDGTRKGLSTGTREGLSCHDYSCCYY